MAGMLLVLVFYSILQAGAAEGKGFTTKVTKKHKGGEEQ
jgi:hypothetical protein